MNAGVIFVGSNSIRPQSISTSPHTVLTLIVVFILLSIILILIFVFILPLNHLTFIIDSHW